MIQLSALARAFLVHRSRQGRKLNTIRVYEQHLEDWQAWRVAQGRPDSLQSVTLQELRDYFAQLAERVKPSTVHNIFRTLRNLWRWAESEEDAEGRALVSDAQARFFARDRIPLPKRSRRERPAIAPDQVEQLLAAAGDGLTEESARNRAIVLLLWESGMRVHELAGLQADAISVRERRAVIVGKGDKQAPVFWGPRANAAIVRYLHLRRCGPTGGALFRGVSSRNNGEGCSANLIRLMLRRLARAAGVELPAGSPCHAFRHGFAREMRRRGLTRQEVGALLRHNDAETTAIYLGLDTEAMGATHRRAFGDRPAPGSAAAAAD